MPLSRRALVAGAVSLCSAGVLQRFVPDAYRAQDALALLERSVGGRLGVAAFDMQTGARMARRAHERFPLLSTFKFVAAAQILARVDAGQESLDSRVRFTRDELVPYSPITEQHADTAGMTVAELCAAAVGVSDNGAGNLLLARLGGPPGLTAYCRSLGDTVTRLDRIEVALNEAAPGDPRDTTSPYAMLSLMERLLVGDALSPSSQRQLARWLQGSTTGGARLRATWPAAWRVGDKTGTSRNGATNDIAIAWPEGRRPLLVAAYFAESPIPQPERDAVLARVGEVVRGNEP